MKRPLSIIDKALVADAKRRECEEAKGRGVPKQRPTRSGKPLASRPTK